MIAIGSDFGGFELKEEIKKYLEEKEIEYIDFGTTKEEREDYPVVASKVAKSIQNKESEKGILICRSGIGMDMVANKFKGIRATNVWSEEGAKLSRTHNNSNILTLGADFINTNEAIRILRMWLATEFEGGRHLNRINMIQEIEKNNMK